MTSPGAPSGRDAGRAPSDVTAELPRLDTIGLPPAVADDVRSQPRPRRPRPPGERVRPRLVDTGRAGRPTRRPIVSADEAAVSPPTAAQAAVGTGPDRSTVPEIEVPAVLALEAAPIKSPTTGIRQIPTQPSSASLATPIRSPARSVPRQSTHRRATAMSSLLLLAATGIGTLLWALGSATVWVVAALPAATAVMIAVFAVVSASLPDS